MHFDKSWGGGERQTDSLARRTCYEKKVEEASEMADSLVEIDFAKKM